MDDLSYPECPALEPNLYGPWFTDVGGWRPYVREVVRRHALAVPRAVSVGIPGSHPVFMTDRGPPGPRVGARLAGMAGRVRTALARRRSGGRWPESLLAAMPTYLEEAMRPCLVPGDITGDHVLVERRGQAWRLAGLIDFGDALVADPAHELVALAVDLFRCNRALLQAQGRGKVRDRVSSGGCGRAGA